MRTTLTLEPEIAERLRQEEALERRSFKRLVNDALARGLGLTPPDAPRPPYRVKPHASSFLPGIDPGKLNQLADELEAVEFIRRNSTTLTRILPFSRPALASNGRICSR